MQIMTEIKSTLRHTNPTLFDKLNKEAHEKGVSLNSLIKNKLSSTMIEKIYKQEMLLCEREKNELLAIEKNTIEMQYLDSKVKFYFTDEPKIKRRLYKLIGYREVPKNNPSEKAYFDCYDIVKQERVKFNFNECFYKRITFMYHV